MFEQEEILRLSEQYVKQMAQESQSVVDGPFAARFTGYGQFQLFLSAPFVFLYMCYGFE